MIERTFKLYLNSTGSPLCINANQYDHNETWLFELYTDTGERYVPSSGAIIGIKADGHGIANTGTVDSEGRVVITETEQMTASAGRAIFELSIDELTHGTANFMVNVERKPLDDGAVMSDTDLSLIQEAIDSASEIEEMLDGETLDEKLLSMVQSETGDWLTDHITNPSNPPIDTSLTVAGAAADAKATGDEITDLKSAIDYVALYRDSVNLFDKSAIITNKSISTTGGIGVADINDLVDNNALNVSPIIPIEIGKYVSNSATNTNKTRILAYDSNGKYKGGIDATVSDGVYTYNIIGNVSFIRFQYAPYVLNVDEYMFVRGETLPDAYEPYGKILIGGTLYDEVDELHNELTTSVDGINTEIGSINTEIDNINAAIDDILETGIEFTETGFINDRGMLINNANYVATDFVNCTIGGTFIPYKYRLKVFANTKIAYYNDSKVFISALSPSESSTLEYVEGEVPYVDGARYVRFCTASNITDYYVKYATVKNAVIGGASDSNPCNYTGNDMSVFNKILCIGDSLTSGTFNYRVGSSTSNYIEDAKYSYPAYLKKLTGCDTTNLGNGGMSSAEWYNTHMNDDLSGYDCVIIQLGVNDCIRYTTWGQTSIDAFTNIINKLKAENKNIKIFIANIIPADSYSNAQYLAFSADLIAWVQSTYASDNSVIPLDMQQYGHTKESTAYNCGHLSAYGYWRLAQDYKGYIGWYMNQNKSVFKEVQFIGTDYYYDPIS